MRATDEAHSGLTGQTRVSKPLWGCLVEAKIRNLDCGAISKPTLVITLGKVWDDNLV